MSMFMSCDSIHVMSCHVMSCDGYPYMYMCLCLCMCMCSCSCSCSCSLCPCHQSDARACHVFSSVTRHGKGRGMGHGAGAGAGAGRRARASCELPRRASPFLRFARFAALFPSSLCTSLSSPLPLLVSSRHTSHVTRVSGTAHGHAHTRVRHSTS